MSDDLRCGVIGAGTMGSLYATAFAQVPGVRVTAIADIDRRRGAALAAAHPAARAFGSVEELLAAGAADAVAVALPDFDHRAGAVAALEAGVHVLCEKPLATTRDDCQAIVRAARGSTAALMVNYGNRHRPAARILRDHIRAGELGAIQSIAFKGHERWTKTMTLHWRDRTDPTWFLVSHIVDAVMWLTGERITTVFGRASSGAPAALAGVDGPNTVTYLVDLEGGAHATLTSSWILPEGFSRGGDFAVEIIGTEGVANVDFNHVGMRFYGTRAHEPVWDWDTPDFDGRRSGWWFTSCRYFIDCVRSGAPPEPGALDGLRVSAVLAAMSASIAHGGPEAVPDWEEAAA